MLVWLFPGICGARGNPTLDTAGRVVSTFRECDTGHTSESAWASWARPCTFTHLLELRNVSPSEARSRLSGVPADPVTGIAGGQKNAIVRLAADFTLIIFGMLWAREGGQPRRLPEQA